MGLFKKFIWSLVLCFSAFAGIVGSKHDLSTDMPADWQAYAPYKKVCVFCHTPHFSNEAIQPLWNRRVTNMYAPLDDNVSAFIMYNSDTSSTLDGFVDPYPNSPSLTCLSCHDGVSSQGDLSAVNAPDTHNLLNGPGPGKIPDTFVKPRCSACHDPANDNFPPRIWRIGPDLTDDHPISITYPTPAQDPDFNLPPDPLKVKGWPNLPLYNGKVECATCHDPHNGEPLFLRMPNDYSQLCKTCHKK